MVNKIQEKALDEDVILLYTHTKRKQLVEHMLQDGIPRELEDKKFLSSLLKDMDHQVVAVKRIKMDEKTNDNQEQAQSLIAQLLSQTHNLRSQDIDAIEGTVLRTIPVLPSTIPVPMLVEGEISHIVEQQTYETFMAEYPQIADE